MELLRTLIGPDRGADVAQLCFRAAMLLVFGLVCIRITGRRTFSQATPLDIIVALVAGSNISRVMTGEVPVWPALAATLVLVALHRLLARLALRWPVLGRVLKGEPVVLVRDGVADRKTMKRHGISEADLLASLRRQQIAEIAQVRLATMEGDGRISMLRRTSDVAGGRIVRSGD